MTNDNKALPWFPITPDYIGYYYDKVLKYIKEVRFSNAPGYSEDSSYVTTTELLFQNAEQIFHDYLDNPIYDKRSEHKASLEKDLKLSALATLLSFAEHRGETQKYALLAAYILALYKPELSDSISDLCLRIIKSEEIVSLGFSIDDIIFFDARSFLEAFSETTFVELNNERWYENHGSVKVNKEGIFIYDTTREFAEFRLKLNGSFKPVVVAEEGRIIILRDKKEKGAFKLSSFLSSIRDLNPGASFIRKDTYQEGDTLTVKVLSKTYDDIIAESTDPGYETITGHIEITGRGSNVRGIYINDIARNVGVGTLINVVWTGEVFSIDQPIIDFIRNKYWIADEDVGQYASMRAILEHPHKNNIMNTWLTEYGFLVRTGFEDYPRYAYRILTIEEYDDDLDFMFASVTDEEPQESPFDMRSARDLFVHRFVTESRRITSSVTPVPEVRYLEKYFLTLLNRILSIKLRNSLLTAESRESLCCVCSALAIVAEDSQDYLYYDRLGQYIHSLESFAKEKYTAIQRIDPEEAKAMDMLSEQRMLDVLLEYGKEEESELLAVTISEFPVEEVSDVAKLVQAANRFIGSPTISYLREDLHTEICQMLAVADVIEVDAVNGDNQFPLPPESDSVEHKMSWVYDNETSQANETTQSAKILKTVCAFMNRYPEQGDAHIYIGADEKRHLINGLQPDIDFLISKNELDAKGDLNDEFSRHVLTVIKRRFPDDHTLVHPDFCCEGKVLDLRITPARNGIVYLNAVPYYRYGSSTRPMTDTIRDVVGAHKAYYRDDVAHKVDAVKRAILSKSSVILHGYNSSHGNTAGLDRTLEVFAFVDNGRFDAVWAFDAAKDKKNKVFLLKRADSIEVLDKKWSNEKLHKTYPLDMFGFFGTEKIDFCMELRSTRAKNNLVEQYPDTIKFMEDLPDNAWRVSGVLSNTLSLAAACAFYLGLADEVDISECPVLKEYVTKRLSDLVERL